jgi:hypothetical protein
LRRALTFRVGLLVILAHCAGMAGCTHNYYYGNAVPVCAETAPVGAPVVAAAPVAAPVVVTAAPASSQVICDVPTSVVGGGLITTAPAGTVVASAPAPRVVVSEPVGGMPFFRGGSRLGWRRSVSSDPASIATTRVEGAIDDDSISR